MAVSVLRFVDEGNFVPFHTLSRGGSNGLVGTLYVDAEVVGDAGGGGVTLRMALGRNDLGFPALWVPTVIGSRDDLATAEVVTFIYDFTNNRRLSSNVHETKLALQAGTVNAALMENTAVPIEPDSDVPAEVFDVIWQTNTLNKVYHLHMFGPVYDLQLIAAGGFIDEFAAGLR